MAATLSASGRESVERRIQSLTSIKDAKGLEREILGIYWDIEVLGDSAWKNNILGQLRSASVRVWNNDLKQLMTEQCLLDQSLFLLQNGIRTMKDLARNLYHVTRNPQLKEAGQWATIANKLTQKVESLGAFSYEDIEVSQDWVNRLVKDCPNLKKLQSLTYSTLKGYINETSPTDLEIVSKLYASGKDIRAEVLKYGLSLEIAEKLEKRGVSSAKELTEAVYNDIVRTLSASQKIPFKRLYSNERERKKNDQKRKDINLYKQELSAAQSTVNEILEDPSLLQKNRQSELQVKLNNISKVIRNQTDWKVSHVDNPNNLVKGVEHDIQVAQDLLLQTSSDQTNEDIVAAVNGGLALSGVLVSRSTLEVTSRRPPNNLLRKPEFVEYFDPTLESKSFSFLSTKIGVSDLFVKSVTLSGLSMTKNIIEAGKEAYYANFEANHRAGKQSGITHTKRKSTYATAVGVSLHPVEAFRIHQKEMQLTDEAKIRARLLQDAGAGRLFLEKFGSHVFAGTCHLGGAIFRIITVETKQPIAESILLQFVKTQYLTESSQGFKALDSPKRITIPVKDPGGNQKNFDGLLDIKSITLGPPISNEGIYRKMLYYNKATWEVIDRDKLESLVPIWELLLNMGEEFKQSAMFIRHAWETQTAFRPAPEKIKSLVVDANYAQAACKEEWKEELQDMKKYIQLQVDMGMKKKPDLTFVTLANICAKVISAQAAIGGKWNTLQEALNVVKFVEFLKYIIHEPATVFGTSHSLIQTIFNQETCAELKLPMSLKSFLDERAHKNESQDALQLADNLRELADRIDTGEIEEYASMLEVGPMLVALFKKKMDSEIKKALHKEATRCGFKQKEGQMLFPLPSVELRNFARNIERIMKSTFRQGDKVSYLYAIGSTEQEDSSHSCIVEGFGTVQSVRGRSALVTWKVLPKHIGYSEESPQNELIPFWKLERATETESDALEESKVRSSLSFSSRRPSRDDLTALIKLKFNDFCVDRESPTSCSDNSEYIFDALRHRAEVFTSSTSQAQRIRVIAPWNNPEKQEESQPDIDNSFVSLIKLVQKCQLSAKMELFRQLLDQRYTVPLVLPDPKTENCQFHVEGLHFVNAKLWTELVPVIDDVSLPRVAFISRVSTDLTENAQMVLEVLQCNATSVTCKQDIGTTAEFGIGFIQSESIEYDAWMVLLVRGDYKQLFSLITQFADIVVLELDQSDELNSHSIPGVSYNRQQKVLRWKNTSQELENFTENDILGICGNFHDVAEEMKLALSYFKASFEVTRSPLRKIRSDYLNVQDEIVGLHEINSFTRNCNFDDMRKSFVLQRSFAKESKSRLMIQRIRSGHNKLQKMFSEVNEEMNFRRRSRHRSKRIPIIAKFVQLLSEKQDDLRVAGLLQIESSIADGCDIILRIEKEVVNRAWEVYQSNPKDTDSLAKYFQVKKEYNDKGVALEHLWRELSHMYSSHPENYRHLPKLAAQHLLDGFSLEVMDGDAGKVNMEWFKDVMAEVDAKLTSELGRKPKAFVISAMGTQSTGKSTLLNTMFGCRLRTSAGQTTRGVNLQLVRAQNRESFDIVLVIDTEGIRSPEFFGTDGAIWRDNRIATFSVLPADCCLITTVSEEDSAIKEVLPIVMLAFKGSNIAENTAGRMSSLIIFVYSRVDTSDQALDKFQQNRRQLLVDLEEAALKVVGYKNERETETFVASTEGETLHSFFAHFETSEVEADSDVKYLGVLNKGERPPNDSPNFSYGSKVVKIREYIDRRLKQNKFRGHELSDWVEYLELVLQCIDTTDFEMTFKTAMEFRAYSELEIKINQARQKVAQEYSLKYEKFETEILDAETEPNLEELLRKLEADAQKVIQEENKRVTDLLKERSYKMFEKTESVQWKHFLDDQRITWTKLLTSVFDTKWKFALLEAQYEESIVSELRKAWKADKKKLQDGSESNLFERIFQQQRKKALQEHPPLNVQDKITCEYTNLRGVDVWQLPKDLETDVAKAFDQKFAGKENVKAVANALRVRIDGLLRSVKRYDTFLVQQSIFLTDETTRQSITNKEAVNMVHTMIYMQLLETFTRIQTEWESKNSVPARLDISKARLQNKFQSICQGFVGARSIAKDLIGGLEQAVKEGFHNQLALDVKANIQSQLWVGRADVMQAHIDLDLIGVIKQGDTLDLLESLFESQQHYKKVLNRLIRESADEERTWLDIKNTLIQGVEGTSTLVQSYDSKRAQIFKNELTKKLPSAIKMKLVNHIWTEMLQEDNVLSKDNWREIGEIVVNNLKTWKSTMVPPIGDDDLGKLVADLLEREGRTSARQRCSEPCPSCSMICIKYAGHEAELSKVSKLHDCAHQPIGLSGGNWVRHPKYARELIPDTCTGLAATSGNFIHSGKWIKWSDFCKTYPSWAMPNISQRQKLREFIFFHYQPELTRRYWLSNTKICTNMPFEYSHDFKQLEDECRAKIQGPDG